jgi:hypothetical protein
LDISQRFSIYESVIRKELENHKMLRKKGMVPENKPYFSENAGFETSKRNKVDSELSLIRLLVYGDKKIKEYLASNLELDIFKNHTLVKIVDFLIRCHIEDKDIIPVSNKFFQDEDSRQLITEAVMDTETKGKQINLNLINFLPEMIINEFNLRN